MNPFQEKIATWLARNGPARSVYECFDLPIVLATDIGLTRSENQDRVAALRIGGKTGGGRPLVAIAVADGMGGMRDGGKCATLALSSFFFALTLYREHDLQRRAVAAISYANDQVFEFASGKGGSTLSSVLIDQELRPVVVNLGDSRVYAFGRGAKVDRLTRDDSLAEAVGGHGRELLQFVGMGDGMQPYVRPIPTGIASLAITTDGIHFVDASTLESILTNSLELRSASERLSALARWCGGPDNASVAMIDLQRLLPRIRSDAGNGIEVWDSSGSLIPIWMERGLRNAGAVVDADIDSAQDLRSERTNLSSSDTQTSNAKQRSKKSKAKKQVAPKDNIQLEIQIERSANPDGTDENSR
jgi:PPM family protein phosphatase